MTSLDQAFSGGFWETENKKQEQKTKEYEENKMKESFEKTFPDISYKELQYLWLDVSPPHYSHKTGIYLCYNTKSGYIWTKKFPDQDLKNSPSLAFIQAFGMEENMIT